MDKETAAKLILIVFLILILLFVAGGPFYRLLKGSAEKYGRCEPTALVSEANVVDINEQSCSDRIKSGECDVCERAICDKGDTDCVCEDDDCYLYCCKKVVKG